MFGPALMACPVGTYKSRSREVYLPKQRGWYDLYTNAYYKGGQTITASAPYERIPVFVPEGAILPFGPEIEWTDQKPADNIILYVYAGHDGEFTLYEDEGTNYDYEKEEYATIKFAYNDARKTLTIGERQGQDAGMLKNRKFTVVYRQPGTIVDGLDLNKTNGRQVDYSGKAVSIKLK